MLILIAFGHASIRSKNLDWGRFQYSWNSIGSNIDFCGQKISRNPNPFHVSISNTGQQWDQVIQSIQYRRWNFYVDICTPPTALRQSWAPHTFGQRTSFWHIVTSSNGNIICVTDPLWGESTPLTKASDAELWYFVWSAPVSKQSKYRWFETPSGSLWRRCNEACTIQRLVYAYVTAIRTQLI